MKDREETMVDKDAEEEGGTEKNHDRYENRRSKTEKGIKKV